jgi:hypothetical protein
MLARYGAYKHEASAQQIQQLGMATKGEWKAVGILGIVAKQNLRGRFGSVCLIILVVGGYVGVLESTCKLPLHAASIYTG